MSRQFSAFLFCVVLNVAAPVTTNAQALSGAPADPGYKYSTPMPPGVASLDKIETRLGTLTFFDGFPDKVTPEKLYDNLDFQRAVQAFLLGMPAVSQAANRDSFRTLGPLNTLLPIYEQLQDARSIILTGNDNTVYNWVWLDLSSGPMVLEVSPKVLGTANDMWQRWVVDVGITGADKGQGEVSVPSSRLQGRRAVQRLCPGRAFADFQPVDSMAQLPGERGSEAGHRPCQEIHKDLSTCRCKQGSSAAHSGEHVGQAVQHGFPHRLSVLDAVE